MSMLARKYVVAAIAVLLGFAYGRISDDWSGVAFFGGLGGLIAVLGSFGCFWMELAPGGAFRRPQAD